MDVIVINYFLERETLYKDNISKIDIFIIYIDEIEKYMIFLVN